MAGTTMAASSAAPARHLMLSTRIMRCRASPAKGKEREEEEGRGEERSEERERSGKRVGRSGRGRKTSGKGVSGKKTENEKRKENREKGKKTRVRTATVSCLPRNTPSMRCHRHPLHPAPPRGHPQVQQAHRAAPPVSLSQQQRL